MSNFKQESNQSLVARLVELSSSERKNQVEILKLLAEIDERRFVVEMGYSGMWDFCRRSLKFSEATSARRIAIARAAKNYPAILAMLDDGRLTLCTAADLVPLLKDGNSEELLAKAAGRPRREVQALAVAEGQKPVVRDVIRRVPAAATVVSPRELAFEPASTAQAKQTAAKAEPFAPALHRVSFTAEDQLVKKLERLQEILGGATLAEVCDKAADLLLDKVDHVRRVLKRERRVATKAKPVSQPKAKPTEPRRLKRAAADRVIANSGRQCAYVSPDGVRCTETRYLTVDHIRPYALGGRSTEDNARCYCAAHNRLAGLKSFGTNFHGESPEPTR